MVHIAGGITSSAPANSYYTAVDPAVGLRDGMRALNNRLNYAQHALAGHSTFLRRIAVASYNSVSAEDFRNQILALLAPAGAPYDHSQTYSNPQTGDTDPNYATVPFNIRERGY